VDPVLEKTNSRGVLAKRKEDKIIKNNEMKRTARRDKARGIK
jgi:hypothetical protein